MLLPSAEEPPRGPPDGRRDRPRADTRRPRASDACSPRPSSSPAVSAPEKPESGGRGAETLQRAGEGSRPRAGSDRSRRLSRKRRRGPRRGKTEGQGLRAGTARAALLVSGGNLELAGDCHAKPHSQGTMASSGNNSGCHEGEGWSQRPRMLLSAEDARGSPLAAPPPNSHGAGGARPGRDRRRRQGFRAGPWLRAPRRCRQWKSSDGRRTLEPTGSRRDGPDDPGHRRGRQWSPLPKASAQPTNICRATSVGLVLSKVWVHSQLRSNRRGPQDPAQRLVGSQAHGARRRPLRGGT